MWVVLRGATAPRSRGRKSILPPSCNFGTLSGPFPRLLPPLIAPCKPAHLGHHARRPTTRRCAAPRARALVVRVGSRGARAVGLGHLFYAAGRGAGLRRGIALGQCGARDDRHGRLDRAAATRALFPERPPLGSWAMASGRTWRAATSIWSPCGLPSALRHAAADAAHLWLRPDVDVALRQLLRRPRSLPRSGRCWCWAASASPKPCSRC